jgi:poly(A) polymerase
MEASGVIDAIFPETKDLILLGKVVGLELRQGFAPDPLMRFLALFWKDADAIESVVGRLKMSNSERMRLNGAVKDETPLWGGVTEVEVRAAVYRVGEQVIRDRILIEWASDGSPDWMDVYALAGAWTRPVLPVNGGDLLALGLTEGPQIGEALRNLENAWVGSDFAAGREELLASLAREMPG